MSVGGEIKSAGTGKAIGYTSAACCDWLVSTAEANASHEAIEETFNLSGVAVAAGTEGEGVAAPG
jgi:hypothetical protein